MLFRATLFAVVVSTIASLIGFVINWNVSTDANKIAKDALDVTEREFALQYTPELRSYLRSWNIYVGPGEKIKRTDNVIIIPLAISNKSYGLAKDVEITFIYNDGASSDKEMSQIIPVLKGSDTVALPPFAPSILADSQTLYSDKKKTFKMKIFLNWKDAEGEQYSAVELYQLGITEAYSDYPSKFVFLSKGYFNTIYSEEDFKRHSSKSIDF